MVRRSLSCLAGLGLLAVMHAALAAAHDRAVTRTSTSAMSPSRSVTQQLALARQAWPDQFAVVLIEARETATVPVDARGTAYVTQAVLPREWMYVRWLRTSPRAPGQSFRLHYWFKPGSGERGLAPGDRAIAFLSPAHADGVYVSEMLLPATVKNLGVVREALRVATGWASPR